MTQDEIIEMARQASAGNDDRNVFFDFVIEELISFAQLVAAKEREACATLCIDEVWASTVQGTAVEAFNYASRECASRIRARGKS